VQVDNELAAADRADAGRQQLLHERLQLDFSLLKSRHSAHGRAFVTNAAVRALTATLRHFVSKVTQGTAIAPESAPISLHS